MILLKSTLAMPHIEGPCATNKDIALPNYIVLRKAITLAIPWKFEDLKKAAFLNEGPWDRHSHWSGQCARIGDSVLKLVVRYKRHILLESTGNDRRRIAHVHWYYTWTSRRIIHFDFASPEHAIVEWQFQSLYRALDKNGITLIQTIYCPKHWAKTLQ